MLHEALRQFIFFVILIYDLSNNAELILLVMEYYFTK